jgi:hypothetical protein
VRYLFPQRLPRPQHHEAAADVVVVTRNLDPVIEPMSGSAAVAGRVVRHNVAIVGHADPHRTTMRVGGAAALGAILMRDETIAVEAETTIKLVVVEQEKPGGGAGIRSRSGTAYPRRSATAEMSSRARSR